MIGSEKQIKWANEIKEKFLGAVNGIDEKKYFEIAKETNPIDLDDFSYEIFLKMVETISNNKSAKTWIDEYKYVKFNDDFVLKFIEESELCNDEEGWDAYLGIWE